MTINSHFQNICKSYSSRDFLLITWFLVSSIESIVSFLKNILFSIHPDHSSLPSASFLPQSHSFSISLKKREGLSRISTEYESIITRCNETRHKPSYSGWRRKLYWRKSLPRTDKRVKRQPPLLLLGITQKHQAGQP